jgi:hypothetical protein
MLGWGARNGRTARTPHMRVPDSIRKCVAFIGYKLADGTPWFAGSGLFFGDDTTEPKYAFIITAKHVIKELQKRGLTEVWLRVNTRSGGCDWTSTDLSKWSFPEDASLDVAIYHGFPNDQTDHQILSRQLALTPTIAQKLNVGVGDEVFITGLFANYKGELRNVPIVRVGNLAAYPEEQILAKCFGRMGAYLIEARSIGGLSGSPVFYHSHSSHKSVFRPFAQKWFSPSEEQSFYLMGIVHGHYDQRDNIEKLNTGIAIVVPIGKILGFVDSERSKRSRDA